MGMSEWSCSGSLVGQHLENNGLGFPAPLRSSSRITKKCFVTYETHDSHFFIILLKSCKTAFAAAQKWATPLGAESVAVPGGAARWRCSPESRRAPRRSVCVEWNCSPCVRKRSACYRTTNVRVIYHQISGYGARRSKECRCRSCFCSWHCDLLMCPDTQLSAGQGRVGLWGTMSLLRAGVP